MNYESATIITLGSFPDQSTGYAEVATFEEAFGEYSEARGRGRAKRAAKRTERKAARSARRTERREGRLANVQEKTSMRDARRRSRSETRQARRSDRKQDRQQLRIGRRAERKRSRQDMRDEQLERRLSRRDERKGRRLARKGMGDEYDEMPMTDQGYEDQGYGDQGYGDQGQLPAGDDQGYDDQGYDDESYGDEQVGWGEGGYDNVGAQNPYAGGSNGSPYADLGYEEQELGDVDMDYYEDQPEYDYSNEDYGDEDYGDEDYGDEDYGDEAGFNFDGSPEMGELFATEMDANVIVPDEVLVRAIKIEWNKELIDKLQEKGKEKTAAGENTTGVNKAIENRLARISELSEEESDFSNASGENRAIVKKAKKMAMNERMRVNPALRGRKLGLKRQMGRKKSMPTAVQGKLGANFSPQRIVVPAQERNSNFYGTNEIDWNERYTATGQELPMEVVELSSNASGKAKTALGKINWVWVGVGVVVAAGAIWALNKYKVIK